MKKIAVLAAWVICILSLSLLTVSLATANTSPGNSIGWADPAPAVPLKAASSAPDAFGYTYQDEVETNGPTFGFIDILGSGTNLNLGDEGNATITIPFSFNFYGVGTDTRASLRFRVHRCRAYVRRGQA